MYVHASTCLDEVGALVRMSFSLLEATHLHVVLGQEQVGRALLLWEVDTDLYECTESGQLLSIRPLQYDWLFPISRPHPFHNFHIIVY